MAIFHLNIQSIGRSTGRRATAAAAYRAGERIVDEKTGTVHDHSGRADVAHREIVLPSRFADAEVSWARDRQQLWNAAERAESRRNARVAREYSVTLPYELSAPQRLVLTTAFSRVIADRYGVAVDVSIHDPRPGGDPRHHHAHLLTTTRELKPDGFGAKTGLELSDSARREQGLAAGFAEFKALRARWAELTNAALREAHIAARVDHRTLAAQGIERAPQHLPWHVYKQAQQAVRSEVVAHTRERYERRGAGSDVAGSPPEPRSLDDIRRRAREAWLEYRAKESLAGRGEGAEAGTEKAPEADRGLSRGGRGDDVAL